MSTGSWDESSNLVPDVHSPTTTENRDEVFDKDEAAAAKHAIESPKTKGAHSKSSSPFKKVKGSRGLGFLIRASHGAHKRNKSPSKSPAKSPSKSPSRESLTKELADDEKVDEAVKSKSEHWQAFLQMQDRIKTNVLKTQSSLGKLATGRISPSGQISPSKQEKRDSKDYSSVSWTQFDNSEGLSFDENEQQECEVDLMLTDLNENGNGNDLSALIAHPGKDLPHLKLTPVQSPSRSPQPPYNSRRSSMEQENLTDILDLEKPVRTVPHPPTPAEEDLLGLSSTDDSTNVQPQSQVYVNEDLLGLGDFLSHPTSPMKTQVTTQDAGMSDWFLGCSTNQSSAQSSLCSSPLSFDQDFLNEQDQMVPDSTAVSDLARSLVDDFLQWGVEQVSKEQEQGVGSTNPFKSEGILQPKVPVPKKKGVSFDPFGTVHEEEVDGIWGSVGNRHKSDKIPMDNLDPFGSKPIPPVESSSNPTSAFGDSDNFGQKDTISDQTGFGDLGDFGESKPAISDQSAAFGDQPDPFGAQSKALRDQSKAFEDKSNAFGDNAFGDQSSGFGEPMDAFGEKAFGESNEGFTDLDPPQTTTASKNPFMMDTSSDQPLPVEQPKAEITFQQNMDFDDDFFEKHASTSAPAGDIWGDGSSSTTQTANPFQDDPFTVDNIPSGNTAFDQLEAKPKNPFLTASFENIAAEAKKANPFLNDDGFGMSDSQPAPSATADFLFDSSATTKETVEGERADIFDPFKTIIDGEHPDDVTDEGQGMVSNNPQLNNSTYDNLDKFDDNEKESFKLEIKSVAHSTLSSGPPPALPPPPKPPKSPQMPMRENPFDRDSPPEENFAKFQVEEEPPKMKDQREMMQSMSTESSTPEEEEKLGPLEDFNPRYEKEGWKLMLRQPTKKKLAGNRFWKTVFVKIGKLKDGPVLKIYNDESDNDPMQELPLQPCYSISEMALQQFDQFGKIHTVKIQYVFYRERVGIRPERITPSFVRKPKPTMILDHAPQVSELLKFGSLSKDDLKTFVWEIENAFMLLEAHREKTLTYNKDEVQAEIWDEYRAVINKEGHVETQKARVRVFFLAFVTGMPTCEIGMNDRRRKGREVVGRHDIIPVKTEDWIRFEEPEFHCSVDLKEYEKTNTLKFHPLDACQFELLRFRVRPKENRELPLQMTVQQILKDHHFEIRCDMLVTGYHANSKKHGQFPCEDIEIRFPIPEPWIYLFRYEKRFGYGSFKAAARKPGKIKGLERLTMMTQGALSQTIMEASVGTAKYEHVYKSVVWRISRLPERNHGAYKSHLFVLRLDLGPHDEVPEKYESNAHVEFTMPACTVSKAQIRSISVSNPNPPEKWVRYLAKYEYTVEIEHINETESEKGSE